MIKYSAATIRQLLSNRGDTTYNRGRLHRNVVLLNPPNNHTRMLRYFNDDDMPLLCYILKHFFYIPPILVVWQCSTSLCHCTLITLKLKFFYCCSNFKETGKECRRKDGRRQRYEMDKGRNRVKDKNIKSFPTEFQWAFYSSLMYLLVTITHLHTPLQQSLTLLYVIQGNHNSFQTFPKRIKAGYHETNITPVPQKEFFGMPIISSLINMNVQLKHGPLI
jgi:hypothetical protein